jgi:peptidoglycan/xylan/chitin deacetylase (PgdA/CDA1 family)
MRNARSAILTYHSIDDSGSVISISANEFERHLESLAASAVPVVPLREVGKRPGSVALTFDDGFRNFRTVAAPVLERYGFSATIFVVSGFCGRDNQWPGQPAHVPVFPLMDWEEVRDVAARGYEIGAHTAHHPDLRKLPPGEASREMTECKADIEQRLGRPATQFAYPYGSVPSKILPPFDLACGTRLSFLGSNDDPLNLPRIDAYYLRTGPAAGSLFSGPAGLYFTARGILRNLRQCLSQ